MRSLDATYQHTTVVAQAAVAAADLAAHKAQYSPKLPSSGRAAWTYTVSYGGTTLVTCRA